jgi:hypothetical protein
MRHLVWIGALLLLPATLGGVQAGDPHACEPPDAAGWLKRWHPVGGWDPYGGGILHWWNPHCFPCAGGPNDYCRKCLPDVCWPPYPPYFQWGPPACPNDKEPLAQPRRAVNTAP